MQEKENYLKRKLGWKEKLENLCVYFMNTVLCILIKKKFFLWKNKALEIATSNKLTELWNDK